MTTFTADTREQVKEVRKSCTTVHTLHTNDVNFRCLFMSYCSTAVYSCCDIFLSLLVACDVGTFHNHLKKRTESSLDHDRR